MNYMIEDGDYVKHETINGGREMEVVGQVTDVAPCQLDNGTTIDIPLDKLTLVRKGTGRFVNLDDPKDRQDFEDSITSEE